MKYYLKLLWPWFLKWFKIFKNIDFGNILFFCFISLLVLSFVFIIYGSTRDNPFDIFKHHESINIGKYYQMDRLDPKERENPFIPKPYDTILIVDKKGEFVLYSWKNNPNKLETEKTKKLSLICKEIKNYKLK